MVNHGKPSLMWNYFTQRNKDEAICNICSKIYGTKGSSTSTLKKHLAVHKEEYEENSLNQAVRDRAYFAIKDKKNINKWQGPALGARSCHLRFTPKERS